MYKTDNKYTQKIYELICQWKDIGVYVLTIAKFKELLVLGNSYPEPTELIRRIIRPAEKELKLIGDVFFDLSVTKSGRVITHLNFIIKTKTSESNESNYYIRVKEDTIHLLRQYFGFKQHHIEQVEAILDHINTLPAFLLDIPAQSGSSSHLVKSILNRCTYIISSLK